jgi:hypothetical protein
LEPFGAGSPLDDPAARIVRFTVETPGARFLFPPDPLL